jgi:hypothetical protein
MQRIEAAAIAGAREFENKYGLDLWRSRLIIFFLINALARYEACTHEPYNAKQTFTK